ncbi:hypothetical protein F5880DRAFT_1512532 [Lentinula raphanica]|nr:hypothetical protein F5880DRAFT_1512532 [Lentinula raphanica]
MYLSKYTNEDTEMSNTSNVHSNGYGTTPIQTTIIWRTSVVPLVLEVSRLCNSYKYESDEDIDIPETTNLLLNHPPADDLHLFANERPHSPSSIPPTSYSLNMSNNDESRTLALLDHGKHDLSLPFPSVNPSAKMSSINSTIAPTRRHPSDPSPLHFLDLEAVDEDDDEVDDEGDTLEADGFIDDARVPAKADFVPFGPGKTTTGSTRNATFLEHLEEVYAHPDKDDRCLSEDSMEDFSVDALLALNNRETDYVEKTSPHINHLPSDWGLYSVECKAGSEYEILFDIMHTPCIGSEVRCAFFNASVGNHLYIEGLISQHDKSSLLEFLDAHSDIRASTLRRVPPDDHQSSLWVRPQNDQVFTRGTWVTIVSPGVYQGDVGLVRGLRVTPGRLSVIVILVPRIFREDDLETMSRPSLELMLDDDLEIVGAQKHSSNGGDYYTYGSEVYQLGLVMMLFAPASLSVARTISGENRKILIESTHPFVLERQHSMPVPEHWSFSEGDEVRVSPDAADYPDSSRHGVVVAVLHRSCEVEIDLDGGLKELIVVEIS